MQYRSSWLVSVVIGMCWLLLPGLAEAQGRAGLEELSAVARVRTRAMMLGRFVATQQRSTNVAAANACYEERLSEIRAIDRALDTHAAQMRLAVRTQQEEHRQIALNGLRELVNRSYVIEQRARECSAIVAIRTAPARRIRSRS